jgi:hypothetical protein
VTRISIDQSTALLLAEAAAATTAAMVSIYTEPGIAGRAARFARRIGRNVLGWVARRDARRRLRLPHPGKRHDLPGELIVSLTSYPARYGTLHLTLGCLLDQSIEADRTILWIAEKDLDQLPAAVRELERRGLEIRLCDDMRSFKKLIPALEAFPNAFISTADDDVYYPRDWLEKLVAGSEFGVITCHRAHRIKQAPSGQMLPYLDWSFDIQGTGSGGPSTDLLPTGVGGILYPPGCLDPRATDRQTFERLCPHGDDLWFYWCARMAGTLCRKVGGKFRAMPWPGTQDSSLWTGNEAGGNDRMIRALVDEFGIESLGL